MIWSRCATFPKLPYPLLPPPPAPSPPPKLPVPSGLNEVPSNCRQDIATIPAAARFVAILLIRSIRGQTTLYVPSVYTFEAPCRSAVRASIPAEGSEARRSTEIRLVAMLITLRFNSSLASGESYTRSSFSAANNLLNPTSLVSPVTVLL